MTDDKSRITISNANVAQRVQKTQAQLKKEKKEEEKKEEEQRRRKQEEERRKRLEIRLEDRRRKQVINHENKQQRLKKLRKEFMAPYAMYEDIKYEEVKFQVQHRPASSVIYLIGDWDNFRYPGMLLLVKDKESLTENGIATFEATLQLPKIPTYGDTSQEKVKYRPFFYRYIANQSQSITDSRNPIVYDNWTAYNRFDWPTPPPLPLDAPSDTEHSTNNINVGNDNNNNDSNINVDNNDIDNNSNNINNNNVDNNNNNDIDNNNNNVSNNDNNVNNNNNNVDNNNNNVNDNNNIDNNNNNNIDDNNNNNNNNNNDNKEEEKKSVLESDSTPQTQDNAKNQEKSTIPYFKNLLAFSLHDQQLPFFFEKTTLSLRTKQERSDIELWNNDECRIFRVTNILSTDECTFYMKQAEDMKFQSIDNEYHPEVSLYCVNYKCILNFKF
ncbi:Lipase [Reticulomyxa filosa]|uniref:Lipase n=1 Tax=Reticulomyxa filosa TaxID=46433 RepID=X6LA11_RETFI|nr:Lipase [Reticulomyxa filosa]|eukprot:ETN97574.1 Lipase [Reticulomyxa filosa]